VRDAKAEFIAKSDAVRGWIDDQCELDPEAWTNRTQLYNAYCLHADNAGSKRLSAREFYNRLEQVGGIWTAGRHGERGFRGIRIQGHQVARVAEVAGSLTPNACAHRGKGVKPATPATSATGAATSMCRDCGENPPLTGQIRCDPCFRVHERIMTGYDD
jgi:hypothetical protein